MNLSDPVTLAALAGAGLLLLIVILLIMAVRAAGRSARVAAPLAQQMRVLGGHVQQLGQGQEQLRGGLQMVSDTQSNTQAQMMQIAIEVAILRPALLQSFFCMSSSVCKL